MSQCPICCESRQLINLTHSCDHSFCQKCCILHLSAKADRFTPLRCAYPECSQLFSQQKNQQLYNKLDEAVKQKIISYNEYKASLQNLNLKACSIPNCKGKINIKNMKKVCNVCNTKHCGKCLKQFHDGACIIDNHDKLMRQANNQKCPGCQIWVQKKEGCNYIDCKCGMKFCFVCGNPFDRDPCRRKKNWQSQDRIRNLLRQIAIKFPSQQHSFITNTQIIVLELLKILIKFPFIVLYVLLCSTFFLTITILSYALIICLSPVIALGITCGITHQNEGTRCCFICIWPIIWVFFVIGFTVVFLLYPIFRQTYHHGILDGFQNCINTLVQIFLRGLTTIFQFCKADYQIKTQHQKNLSKLPS